MARDAFVDPLAPAPTCRGRMMRASVGSTNVVRIRMCTLAALAALSITACGSSSTTTVTTVVPPTSATTTTVSSPTLTSSTSTVTTQPTATTALPVLFEGVVSHGSERPSTLELTGDGTLEVSGVQWTAWGGDTATGTGNASYHGCTPNCAAAPVSTASVAIKLSNVRVCAGRRYYASLTLTLPSGKLLDESFVQRSWSPC